MASTIDFVRKVDTKTLPVNSKEISDTTDDDAPFVSTFEKLLDRVISDGVYQKRMIFIFMIPVALLYGVTSGSVVLLLETPDHTCHVPGRNEANISSELWRNLTIPWEEGKSGRVKLSKCSMYNETFYGLLNAGTQYNFSQHSESIIPCQHGWDYDNSSWNETPITKFDWVCDKKNAVPFIFTSQLVSAAIGTFTLALLSDMFGRKPIFLVTLILNLVFGLAIIFAPSLIYFGIFKFISALAFYNMYQLPYIIVIEISSLRLRNLTTSCVMVCFVLATCYNVLMALLLKGWKMFVLSTQLPVVILIFYYSFIPESPRWLLSRGKLAECEKVMTKIATTNGTKFTDEMRQHLLTAQEEEKKKIPATKILTSFVLTKHLILTSILLGLNFTVYLSLSFNVHNMHGNLLINYLVLCLFELPGNIMASVSCSYFGRRTTAFVWPLFSAASIFAASYLTEETWPLTLACGITKMFTRFQFFAVYVQIGEMFPTSLRAAAYGITGVISMIGPIASPSLIALGFIKAELPYYIMCGICVASSLIATFLPETLGQPLPQTLKEAKNVGKGQSYFTVITKWTVYKAVPKEEYHNDNIKNLDSKL